MKLRKRMRVERAGLVSESTTDTEIASITSKGDRLIVYCKGLVKEQLDKGNTVKYNNIKRAVIEKFDRATHVHVQR